MGELLTKASSWGFVISPRWGSKRAASRRMAGSTRRYIGRAWPNAVRPYTPAAHTPPFRLSVGRLERMSQSGGEFGSGLSKLRFAQ